MAEAAPSTTTTRLEFRPPSSSPATSTFTPPSLEFVRGAWFVTHSSLPMWKSNKNVVIMYTPLSPPAAPEGSWDNLVEYNAIDSDKRKTVAGIEKPDAHIPAAWNWRGKGLLMIASSHWEVLGYGDDEGGWCVTYFEKTLFTPAGIDVLVKRKGTSPALIERIKAEMGKFDDATIKKIVESIFEVKHDG